MDNGKNGKHKIEVEDRTHMAVPPVPVFVVNKTPTWATVASTLAAVLFGFILCYLILIYKVTSTHYEAEMSIHNSRFSMPPQKGASR